MAAPRKKGTKTKNIPIITKSLLLAKRTQLEMMEDRGYIVEKHEWESIKSINILQETLNKSYVEEGAYNPFYIIYKPSASKSHLQHTIVAFISRSDKDTKINIPRRNAIISTVNKNVEKLIFIYLPTNSQNNRLTREINLSYEEFEAESLQINPYRTNYNDKFTPLTATERDMLCLHNNITTAELSGLSVEDASVKYLGIAVNTVVRLDIRTPLPVMMKNHTIYCEVRNIPIIYASTDIEKDDEDIADEEDEEEEEEDIEGGGIGTDASVFIQS